MKFRWQDKAQLLVPPQGCGTEQRWEAECRTKCFSFVPINSLLEEKKSHAEVQLSLSEAVSGDKTPYWQVILICLHSACNQSVNVFFFLILWILMTDSLLDTNICCFFTIHAFMPVQPNNCHKAVKTVGQEHQKPSTPLVISEAQ